MTDESVLTNSLGMKFKVIPSGTFTMGTEDGQSHEGPPHVVTLTSPFELGIHPVTQEQYQKIMGVYKDIECPHCKEVFTFERLQKVLAAAGIPVDVDKVGYPSLHDGPNNPVEYVTWADAVEFCQKLSALPDEKAAGHAYRLPTEAEWEYACRAGTTTRFYWGEDETNFEDYVWRKENSDDTTHPVGQKKPNPWGIFDMLGNVEEWCSDEVTMYDSSPQTDPQAPESGDDNPNRIIRGGNLGDIIEKKEEWQTVMGYSAYRSKGGSNDTRGGGTGFRVVRTASE